MASERILLVGSISAGVTHWHIAPPPAAMGVAAEPTEQPQPLDGELWRMICEAEETQDLIDNMLDREDWSRGAW